MTGRKRRVNNKARTKDVSAGADEDTDEDLDEAAEDDSDVVLSDDAEDMETDGSDTLELPAISDISGSAATASARRRVEDYLEMKRAAQELHELEDFDAD